MKKFLSLLLTLTLMLSLAVPAMAAGTPTVTLTADKTSAVAGEDITLTLTIDESVGNLNAFQFNIVYNSELFELKNSSIGTACALTQVGNPGTLAGGEAYIPVSALDTTGDPVALAAGVIATLTFTAKTDVTGEATFNVLKETMADYDSFVEMEPTMPQTPITVPVAPAPAAKGYTLTAAADITVNVGENVSVAFTVGNTEETVTEYNAYDMSFTYDSEKLTYVSAVAADEDASINEKNGVVRVIGYGENKKFDTAAVTLTFTTKAAGEAEVKATAANIDNRTNAPDKDTPAATRVDNTTLITVEEKYVVNLGDGLTSDSLIAKAGEDYIFRATDEDNYNYTVTAVLTGTETPVTVTDNGDGTYTIPGAEITGPITVSAVKTGKEQPVTVQGSGADDVTATSTANYGTDYTFTVNKQIGYKYTVMATVDGTEVTLTPGENGAYTIAGTAITGPVVIAVTKTQEGSAPSYSVSKPAYVSGADTATKGEDYTFSILTEAGYSYSEPEVTVGGKTVSITKNEDGSYTIAAADITGDIVIKVTRTSEKGIAVTEYITLDEQSIYLITVSNVTGEGNIAKYAGNSMYWSAKYGAYAWLVVSDKTLAEMETEADNNVTIAAGTAAATVSYTGNVNMTDKTDVNDAQLVYDMYKARYENFDMGMQKFLNADINGSRTVDTSDAAAIVDVIKTIQTA